MLVAVSLLWPDPKSRSNVVLAASRTRWQSGQSCRWFRISSSTDGESFPSKYQQIKWIVSRQLIFPSVKPFLKGRWVVTIWLHLLYQRVPSLLQFVISTKSASYEIRDRLRCGVSQKSLH